MLFFFEGMLLVQRKEKGVSPVNDGSFIWWYRTSRLITHEYQSSEMVLWYTWIFLFVYLCFFMYRRVFFEKKSVPFHPIWFYSVPYLPIKIHHVVLWIGLFCFVWCSNANYACIEAVRCTNSLHPKSIHVRSGHVPYHPIPFHFILYSSIPLPKHESKRTRWFCFRQRG